MTKYNLKIETECDAYVRCLRHSLTPSRCMVGSCVPGAGARVLFAMTLNDLKQVLPLFLVFGECQVELLH